MSESELEARRLAEVNQGKADFVAGINGNLKRLEVAIKMLDRFIKIAPGCNPDELAKYAADIREQLADLATLTRGWHQMALERGFVEDTDDA